jgi:two-component sensor histidine kinase
VSLLNNFLKSGHPLKKEENLKGFQLSLLNSLLLTTITFATLSYFASLFNFFSLTQEYQNILILYIITNAYQIILLRRDKNNYLIVAHTTLLISTLLFYFTLITPRDEFRLIWFFLLLFAQFILLGKKIGLLWMFFILSSIFLLNYYYPLGFTSLALFTFFNSFLIFSVFVYFFIDKIENDAKELTRLKQVVEKRMQTALQEKNEKELLLQEVHHRVKNNLHIILSMIQLQQNNVNTSPDNTLLIDLENRINTIAKTYEMLIINDKLEEIDMSLYIQQLLKDIQESFDHHTCDVTFTTKISAILPLKEAVYVGLIVNELVTNAYKYAFDTKKGNIVIKLHQSAHTYTLIVNDNGKGFDQESQDISVGSQLIHALVTEQLSGSMHIMSDNATHYTIIFTL